MMNNCHKFWVNGPSGSGRDGRASVVSGYSGPYWSSGKSWHEPIYKTWIVSVSGERYKAHGGSGRKGLFRSGSVWFGLNKGRLK